MYYIWDYTDSNDVNTIAFSATQKVSIRPSPCQFPADISFWPDAAAAENGAPESVQRKLPAMLIQIATSMKNKNTMAKFF